VRPWRRERAAGNSESVCADRILTGFRGFVQHLGGARLGVLAIGRIVSPLQRELYRRSGGRLSLAGRAPVLLLTTTGRRTGKPRAVPLLYLRDGDCLVICNVNPGFEQPNPWVLNLRAEPHAQVQIGRRITTAAARPASEDELRVSYVRLNEIVNGRRGISSSTALRLARALGTSPQFWLNGQLALDLYRASHDEEELRQLERIEPVTR